MKQAFIWLGVLVVVVVVVLVIKGGAGKEETVKTRTSSTGVTFTPGQFETTYDKLAASLAGAGTDKALEAVIGAHDRWKCIGTGTVLAAEQGDEVLEVDVDVDGDGKADVYLDVVAAVAEKDGVPSVGQKVNWKGAISVIDWEDGTLILECSKSRAVPAE